MRGLWQSSSCVGVLALVMLAQPASAERESDVEYEMLWVDKSLNTLQHAKRKAVCQLDGWSLCPASVGGGVSKAQKNNSFSQAVKCLGAFDCALDGDTDPLFS